MSPCQWMVSIMNGQDIFYFYIDTGIEILKRKFEESNNLK